MDLFHTLNAYFYKVTLGELRMMNKSILSADISYNTLKYLDLISLIEDCTATKLAALLGISKPAVTMKVNEMIQEGLVVRRQSMKDKRVYFLELEEETARAYKRYDDRTYNAATEAEQKYTREELESFCRILTDIGAHFAWDDLAEGAPTP